MELNLPGNVYLYKDENRPGQLDAGDIVSFPAGENGEALVTYNEATAPLIDAMIAADEEYPFFRLQDECKQKDIEAFVSYVPDQNRITFQSVRFTGNIKPYIRMLLKKEALAQK